MANEERIKKWRQGAKLGQREPRADNGTLQSAVLRNDDRVMAGTGAIPSRREEELEAIDALRAEIADSQLPSEEDIDETVARDAARRWWQGVNLRRRALGVLGVPLLVVAVYALLFSPAIQSVNASFAIMRAGGAGDIGPTAGLLGVGGGEGLADAYRIREYLQSREAMQQMEKRYGFLSHFRKRTHDPFSRPMDISMFGIDAHDFYQRKIHIGIDMREGIVRLGVEALTPEGAKRFANGLLALARERTKTISDQLNADQSRALQEDVQRAQAEMRQASAQLAAVQRRKNELDPELAGATIYQLIGNLEGSYAEKQAQRHSIVANGLTESPLLARIDAEIASLKDQIAVQRRRLVGSGGDGSVAGAIADMTQASTRLRLSQTSLESSLRTFEQARLSSIEQRRYLVVISVPVLPHDVRYARFLSLMGLTLVVTLLIWGLFTVIRSSLFLGGGR